MILLDAERCDDLFPRQGIDKIARSRYGRNRFGQMAAIFFCSRSARASFSGERSTMSLGSVSRWTGYFFFDPDVPNELLPVDGDLEWIFSRFLIQIDADNRLVAVLCRIEVDLFAVERPFHRASGILHGDEHDVAGSDLFRRR